MSFDKGCPHWAMELLGVKMWGSQISQHEFSGKVPGVAEVPTSFPLAKDQQLQLRHPTWTPEAPVRGSKVSVECAWLKNS